LRKNYSTVYKKTDSKNEFKKTKTQTLNQDKKKEIKFINRTTKNKPRNDHSNSQFNIIQLQNLQ